jgi:L,D-transpeptidase YcbB
MAGRGTPAETMTLTPTLVHRRTLIIALAFVTGTACAGATAARRAEMDSALRATLGAPKRPAFVTADAEGARLWKLTHEFYAARDYAPAWIEDAKPQPQIDQLIAALNAAADEGLDPQLYNVALIDTSRTEASRGWFTAKGFDPREAGVFDAWFTYLYLKYASDLADGLSDLAHADRTWRIKAEAFDPRGRLERALAEDRVAQSLLELTPDNRHYRALRQALAEHRAMASRGGWPPVPASVRLKPGQRSRHAGVVARRLATSGDYTGPVPPDGEASVYDRPLIDAVKRFQRRHGLADDGVVGPGVVAEMNVPLDTRIRQIELNLERWRWLPRELGDRYVLVNIPEYHLEVWEGDRVPMSMRVVVGKEDTPTPIFNDEMTYLVFSPYWNVPPSIAEGETLPAVLTDPGFLERTNMEVLDPDGNVIDPETMDLSDPALYRFRQRPGTSNSLGLVKFMFPNQYDVYLHDTPADSLFARASRSFSHGCVRVEDPLALAEYVLGDQPDWDRTRIKAAMNAHEERTVRLRRKLPVYLGYWTARVAGDGVVQFRKDVYGIDKRLSRLLADRLSRLRRSAAAAGAVASGKPTGPRPARPGSRP